MALIRQHSVWDPFRELREMSDRVNRLFALEPAARTNGDGQSLTDVDWAPAVNISETDKAYVIRVDLPQVKKEDVTVQAEDGLLTIRGERKQEKREENERFHRVESYYGRFLRRFALPEDGNEDAIEATFKDGALEVSVPKTEKKELKARQIAVH